MSPSGSGLRDNHTRGSVADFLNDRIQPGSKLSVVSAYFTIYAYDALKGRLDGIDHLDCLFGEPTFMDRLDPRKTQLVAGEADSLRSQFATLKKGRGEHRKYSPMAFTEQGVAMLSSVLRSPRAVQVNVEIMRAFVRLRRMLESNAELSRKLDALERKYDGQFRVVFEAIRELMTPARKPGKRIGFQVVPPRDGSGSR